jgi:hypothetical protein
MHLQYRPAGNGAEHRSPDQPHIWYEVCRDHGMFMDAGEFTDYKNETLADWFRSLLRGARPA